jgi:hypothetical protein
MTWLRRFLCHYFGIHCPSRDFTVRGRVRSIYPWRNTMSETLTVHQDDSGHYNYILDCFEITTPPNTTPATGVAVGYTTDNAAAVTVDATSGALAFLPQTAYPATATITGTGTRGTFSHSDTLTVTVIAPAGADFTVQGRVQAS